MLNWLRKLRPIMIENSKVPVILSRVAPIEIWAFSFGPFVWCRGVMSETTKRHESIHFAQQIECLFVIHWALYGWYWFRGIIAKKSGREAYYANPFEEEAYMHENDKNYLENRPFYHWKKYI